MMLWVGVNEIVAVVDEAAVTDPSVIARPLIPGTSGNVPALAESKTITVDALKSLEVPAATLVRPACPLEGVVNFVNVSVTAVPPAYVPSVSFTVNTELEKDAEHLGLPDAGAVTVQTCVGSTAMPAPDSVMAIPAL